MKPNPPAPLHIPSTCDSLMAGRFSFGFWCWWALANPERCGRVYVQFTIIITSPTTTARQGNPQGGTHAPPRKSEQSPGGSGERRVLCFCVWPCGSMGLLSFRAGLLSFRAGQLNFRAGPLGFRAGLLSFRSGPLGFRAGPLSFRAGPFSFRTGLLSFRAGPLSFRADSQENPRGFAAEPERLRALSLWGIPLLCVPCVR